MIRKSLHRLKNGHTISLTTDGWASADKQGSKYNSLTCSYLDPQTARIVTMVLGIAPSTSSQTSETILNEIVKILELFKISEKNFKFILVTDTAAPMKKLIKIVTLNLKIISRKLGI